MRTDCNLICKKGEYRRDSTNSTNKSILVIIQVPEKPGAFECFRARSQERYSPF